MLNTQIAPSFAKEISLQFNLETLSKFGHKLKMMRRRVVGDYAPPKKFKTFPKLPRTLWFMGDRFHLVPNQWRSVVYLFMISLLRLDQQLTMDKAGEKLIPIKKSWKKFGLALIKTNLDRASKDSIALVKLMEMNLIVPREDSSLREQNFIKRWI
jgi:hypothetical protein